MEKPQGHFIVWTSAENCHSFWPQTGQSGKVVLSVLSVFSTPKGIMADMDAKKDNLGGEFLFNIW